MTGEEMAMSKTNRTIHRAISRRAMLRGVGVGLALPLLESMEALRAQSAVTA